jgi:hypothetical protein
VLGGAPLPGRALLRADIFADLADLAKHPSKVGLDPPAARALED